MYYYFAPLEGITDLTYRTLHHKHFGGVDRYYMPFLSPTQNHCLTKKEQRELPPAELIPCPTIPQILTKSPVDFLWAVQVCADRGYEEVNINMGCPSGTVVAKGKGSGMLKDLSYLRAFLDEIFSRCPLKISVKTRIGLQDAEALPHITEILNNYPFTEWILHPRVQKDFYKGPIDMNAFRYAACHSKLPLCYNGDICSLEDIAYIQQEFPEMDAIMIGRGLIADPGMLRGATQRTALYTFHEELFDEYCKVFGNDRNAMCRMKEIWSMLIRLFGDSERHNKKLKKATDYKTFRALTREVLADLPIIPQTPGIAKGSGDAQ